MGRRSRLVRPGRLTWVVVFLGFATLLTSAQAGSEQPQFVTQAHEDKPFRIDVPEGWSVEWDHLVGRNREADMVAFGPEEGSYRTNVGVDSKVAEVTETDEYLLETGQGVIDEVRRFEAVAILRPPAVVETANSRAAVYVIMYEALPVAQVVAIVGSQTLDRVWTIVGTSALVTAEKNEPIFQTVIASFEVLGVPDPAFIGTLSSPLLVALAGSAALLGGWVLYRRRHEVVTLVRTLRDEGRIPSQFETPLAGVEEFEEIAGDSEDRP
jgi:hypothetical protein